MPNWLLEWAHKITWLPKGLPKNGQLSHSKHGIPSSQVLSPICAGSVTCLESTAEFLVQRRIICSQAEARKYILSSPCPKGLVRWFATAKTCLAWSCLGQEGNSANKREMSRWKSGRTGLWMSVSCRACGSTWLTSALRRRGVGGTGGEGWIPEAALQFTSQLDWIVANAVLHQTLSCWRHHGRIIPIFLLFKLELQPQRFVFHFTLFPRVNT